MQSEEKRNFSIGIVVVIIVIGAVAWFLSQKDEEATTADTVSIPTAPVVSPESLSSHPADAIGESIPDTNPLGGKGTNPFSGYKNPFE